MNKTIPCTKLYKNGCDTYMFIYDSKNIRIEKDLSKDHYTRVFVDDILVSRERETSKKVEVRIQGKTKKFFLHYWYKSRLSMWLGKAFFGVGATINQIPVEHTVSDKNIQLASGTLGIFFFSTLILSRTILTFRHPTIIAAMGLGHQLPIEAPFYFFLLFLFVIYLFTYTKNPNRAIAGTLFIGITETSIFAFSRFWGTNFFLLTIFFFCIRLIALRSLWTAWLAGKHVSLKKSHRSLFSLAPVGKD